MIACEEATEMAYQKEPYRDGASQRRARPCQGGPWPGSTNPASTYPHSLSLSPWGESIEYTLEQLVSALACGESDESEESDTVATSTACFPEQEHSLTA